MRPLGLMQNDLPRDLVALPAKLLAVQKIDQVDAQLAKALGLDPVKHISVGLLTCDEDDALYTALDHCTKFADVDVLFARSFYAGAKHASGPFSGEILGIVAGANPDHVAEALWAVRDALAEGVQFHTFAGENQPAFFAHVIHETGRYLAPLAGVEVGAPIAYLIAPPLEAALGVDAALKAAAVRLLKWMPPPSETNFAGAYLAGDQADLEAAALAFVEAIRAVAKTPLAALRRPERLRK
jgi:ethanolamine utilization protein EutL